MAERIWAALTIKEISIEEATTLVQKWHYSKVMPRLTKVCVGGFRGEELVAAATFGWGRRPLNTIQNIFPSLIAKDYLEFGKLCIADPEPKNTESYFISQCIYWLKKNRPDVRVLYSWADGLWGKPGYIYQASNFLYGGYIETDRYLLPDGTIFNPSSLRKVRPDWAAYKDAESKGVPENQRPQRRFTKSKDEKRPGAPRPSKSELKEWGWMRAWGKQFRYLYFLCNENEARRLLAESKIEWFSGKGSTYANLKKPFQNVSVGTFPKTPDATVNVFDADGNKVEKVFKFKSLGQEDDTSAPVTLEPDEFANWFS